MVFLLCGERQSCCFLADISAGHGEVATSHISIAGNVEQGAHGCMMSGRWRFQGLVINTFCAAFRCSLSCTVLSCIALLFVLHWLVLNCTALSPVLPHPAWHCFFPALCCPKLHCPLSCTVLYCIALPFVPHWLALHHCMSYIPTNALPCTCNNKTWQLNMNGNTFPRTIRWLSGLQTPWYSLPHVKQPGVQSN